MKALAATPIEQLPGNLGADAGGRRRGRSAFKVHCVQCHGRRRRLEGLPNLNDDDWLWGGDLNAIHFTIEHGARPPDHAQTRMSQMPAFGRDGMLQPTQVQDLTAYVHDLRTAEAWCGGGRGGALFAQNCAACHGRDGKGNRSLGAPNLTDAIWLYGGDADSINATITNSRYGVMPRWGTRLDSATVKMLAACTFPWWRRGRKGADGLSIGGGTGSLGTNEIMNGPFQAAESQEPLRQAAAGLSKGGRWEVRPL